MSTYTEEELLLLTLQVKAEYPHRAIRGEAHVSNKEVWWIGKIQGKLGVVFMFHLTAKGALESASPPHTRYCYLKDLNDRWSGGPLRSERDKVMNELVKYGYTPTTHDIFNIEECVGIEAKPSEVNRYLSDDLEECHKNISSLHEQLIDSDGHITDLNEHVGLLLSIIEDFQDISDELVSSLKSRMFIPK